MNPIDRAVLESIDRVTEKILGEKIRGAFETNIQKQVEDAVCKHIATTLTGKLEKQLEKLAADVGSALTQMTDLSAKVKDSLKTADRDIRAKIEKAVAAIEIDATPDPTYKAKLEKIVADLIVKVASANDSRTGSNILVPILKEKILKKVSEMEFK
jgi:uncharacterized membrane-anchored protein YjiN (DUF445 family)